MKIEKALRPGLHVFSPFRTPAFSFSVLSAPRPSVFLVLRAPAFSLRISLFGCLPRPGLKSFPRPGLQSFPCPGLQSFPRPALQFFSPFRAPAFMFIQSIPRPPRLSAPAFTFFSPSRAPALSRVHTPAFSFFSPFRAPGLQSFPRPGLHFFRSFPRPGLSTPRPSFFQSPFRALQLFSGDR